MTENDRRQGRTGTPPAPASRRLAAELRRRREDAGISQRALAKATYFSSSYITKLESGAEFPSPKAIHALDGALRAGGALVTLAQQARAERRDRRTGSRALTDVTPSYGPDTFPAQPVASEIVGALGPDPEELDTNRRDVLRLSVAGTASLLADSTLGSIQRVQWLGASNVDAGTLEQLDLAIERVVDVWEHQPAKLLLPHVLRHQQWVDRLLRGHQHPEQQRELYLVAGKLSGLLGYLSFDLGDFAAARTHCVEALTFADYSGQAELRAWVRGTQSMIALYAGRYRDAVDYARDGRRFAGNGAQAVRLAVHGEARALARLNDARGVDEAVGRAYDAMDQVVAPEREQHSDVSFTSFTGLQLALYTGSAYVALGDADKARGFAEKATTMRNTAGVPGMQALAKVDLAMSLLQANHPEPEMACALVTETLELTADRPYDALTRRVLEFLHAAARWRDMPAVRHLAEVFRTWRPTPSNALTAGPAPA